MKSKISITGKGYNVDEATKKYILKKVGRLWRYLPRHARKSASADVIVAEVNKPHGNKYEVEVVMRVPNKTLAAKDSTVNALAALDIVESKLVGQLHRYKLETVAHLGRKRSILSRLKRGYSVDTAEI